MKSLLIAFVALMGLPPGANAQCASGYTQLSNVFACQQNTTGAPVITSPSTASGNVGAGFTYQITATNSPTSWSATGLPPPLTVNTSTGLISGTPTAASSGTVVLGATNATGTGNENLALTIGSSAGTTIFSDTLSGDGGNSDGQCMWVHIPSAHLAAAPGTSQVKVTFKMFAGTTAGESVTAHIGENGTTGNWSFNGNQVQLKFGGNTTYTTVAGAQTFTSDPIAFTYSNANDLTVSTSYSGGGTAEVYNTDTLGLTSAWEYASSYVADCGVNQTSNGAGTAGQNNPATATIIMQ